MRGRLRAGLPSLVVATALLVAGCGGARPGADVAPVGPPPGIGLLETHCAACHSLDRSLDAGGTEGEWVATLDRHLRRYAIAEVTGLSAVEGETIVAYLAAVRPPDTGRRALRTTVLGGRSSGDAPRSGAPGPREPRGESKEGKPAEGGVDDRLPTGPDPVLAEGRPGKPLDTLDLRMREAVERGELRFKAEGCAACHRSDAELRSWLGGFPQVPIFRPEAGVVTLAQAVEHWRRRPGGPLADEGDPSSGGDELVAYLAWRADGAPMAPGRAYALPPAADLERLEQAVARGRRLTEGVPGRAERGACGGCHGVAGAAGAGAPEIVGSAALFPRFAPELGRVAGLGEYLTGHLATMGRDDALEPARLGRPGDPDVVAAVAYLAWLARDRLVDVGRPPGARARGSAELGRELFELRCGICHDPQTSGGGALGPGLAGLFGDHRPAPDASSSRDAVVRVIQSGARGMPAFFDLTAAQIEDLVAYLRTL